MAKGVVNNVDKDKVKDKVLLISPTYDVIQIDDDDTSPTIRYDTIR